MCGFSNMACAILNLYGELAWLCAAPSKRARRLSFISETCAALVQPNQCFLQPLATELSAGVEYGSRNVLADPEVREGVKRYTAWPTIPQV
jgi:glutaredoxin-related protein